MSLLQAPPGAMPVPAQVPATPPLPRTAAARPPTVEQGPGWQRASSGVGCPLSHAWEGQAPVGGLMARRRETGPPGRSSAGPGSPNPGSEVSCSSTPTASGGTAPGLRGAPEWGKEAGRKPKAVRAWKGGGGGPNCGPVLLGVGRPTQNQAPGLDRPGLSSLLTTEPRHLSSRTCGQSRGPEARRRGGSRASVLLQPRS